MMFQKSAVPHGGGGRLKDAVLAISISNLLLLDVWRKLIFADQFLLPTWSWRDLVAVLVNIGLFAAIIYGIIRLVRRPPLGAFHIERWVCLLPIVVIANYGRRRQLEALRAHWGDLRVGLLLTAGLLLIAYVLVRWRRQILNGAEITVLCMTAFVPLATIQAAWVIAQQPPLPVLATPLPPRPNQPRIVWILFDEMDWRYVFSSRRPRDLNLPEIDRLRSQAFSAEDTSQAGLQTVFAIPSLITGTSLFGGYSEGKSLLVLKSLNNGAPLDVGSAPNVFREARRRNVNVGVVGWYMPYCRLMKDALTTCYWESLDTEVHSQEPDLRVSILSQLLTVSPLEKRQRHERRFQHMLQHAMELASDKSLGFVLLHLPVPHGPAIYDRRQGRLTALNTQPDWYLDNLALADVALGDIRRAMEASGLWDESTVIVSSDHSLRWYSVINESTDARIPFLVKLQGQQHGITYTSHFNAVLSHDLLLSIMDGEIAEPGQLVPWFDRHENAYLAGLHQAQVRASLPVPASAHPEPH